MTEEMPTCPRWLPDRRLPPYAFVAGSWPHPIKDPSGHLYGDPELEVAPLDASNWSTHEAYLWAIDLFNTGYYWEAHEQWESLWLAAGRQGRDATMLKALIKLAAASLKIRQGRPLGVCSHCEKAAALLKACQEEGLSLWYGLALDALLLMCEQIPDFANRDVDADLPVARTHPYLLLLSLDEGCS